MADVDYLTSAAESRVGSILKGKWHLDRLLGMGGMAAVYEAHHRNGSRVAIKILHRHLGLSTRQVARFQREGYAANRVGHRAVVTVHDDDVDEHGSPFLVMELLSGENAATRASTRGGTLPAEEVLALADEVLDVLALAHSRDILHRDIKPENLFVTSEGVLRVLDFGIARINDCDLGWRRTEAGTVLGSPAFVPPEQARGRVDRIDARSDLWAVGATMFTLLSGRFVHDGATPNEQLGLAMTVEAVSLRDAAPNTPTALVQIVDVALAYGPEQRWADARTMQAAVRWARAHWAELNVDPVSLSPPATWPTRSLVAVMGGATSLNASRTTSNSRLVIGSGDGAEARMTRGVRNSSEFRPSSPMDQNAEHASEAASSARKSKWPEPLLHGSRTVHHERPRARSGAMRPNATQIVESVYDLERDTDAWITGILGQLEPWLGDRLGAFGFTYSVSDAGALLPGSFATLGCSPAMADELPFAVTQITPEVVRHGYLGLDCASSSEVPGWNASVAANVARRAGVAEIWSINGRLRGKRGCALFVNRRSGGAPSVRDRRLLARTAEQVASAQRLRERLRLADAIEWSEAVIAPTGKIHHAVGGAKSQASLDLLRAGVLAMERERRKERTSDADRRGTWKGLVDGRWTLLEHFASDGRRYILAQENEPSPPTLDALTPRERRALVSAALGHSNKEIADALGMTHSAARVLMGRIARKLGARTRAELLRRFAALDSAGGVSEQTPP